MTSKDMRSVDPEAVLGSPRLLLEPLGAHHAAPLHEHLLDERLYEFIPQDPPSSLQRLEDRYRVLSSRRSPDGREAWLNWAVRLRDNGDYAGVLEATVYGNRTAEIAYTVFVPHQRRGIASEAGASILAHLFDDCRVDVVAAEVDTRNAASVALLESLGFRRVSTVKDADHFKGAPSDEYRYELRNPGRGAGSSG